jgi:hypothetical protein
MTTYGHFIRGPRGQTKRGPSWSGWDFFGRQLGIRKARAKECRFWVTSSNRNLQVSGAN